MNPTVLAREVFKSRAMRDAYSITRKTRVSDGGGGFVDGTSTVLTGVCQFTKNTGVTERSGPDRIVQRGDYTMKIEVDADVLPTDQPVVMGRTFLIVWTPPVDSFAVYRMVGLQEVGGGS